MNIKIFVLRHKATPLPNCFANTQIYTPIQCGRALSSPIPNALGDDSGDNISRLNLNYNEMTAVYWVAKHYSEIGDPEYVGFDHYRRFLNWSPSWLSPNTVIARKWFSWRPLDKHFALCHPIDALKRFSNRFEQCFTDQRDDYRAFWKSHGFYICNIFIMHRENFKRYAEFIIACIDILRSLGNEHPFGSCSVVEQRIPGYILERMTCYWIWREKKQKRINVKLSTITHFNAQNNVTLPGNFHDNGFLWFLRKAY